MYIYFINACTGLVLASDSLSVLRSRLFNQMI